MNTDYPSRSILLRCYGLLSAALIVGCQQAPPPNPSPEAPGVPVSQPVRREVTDFMDYTGRIAAVNAVDVRPRVTGYLVNVAFKEGAKVKKDDLLFEIDPPPYQATGDRAAPVPTSWPSGKVRSPPEGEKYENRFISSFRGDGFFLDPRPPRWDSGSFTVGLFPPPMRPFF